jgi:hypothetical protein
MLKSSGFTAFLLLLPAVVQTIYLKIISMSYVISAQQSDVIFSQTLLRAELRKNVTQMIFKCDHISTTKAKGELFFLLVVIHSNLFNNFK